MALLKAILEKAREEEEARLNFEPEEESEEKKLGLIPIPRGPITQKKGDLDLKCVHGKVVTNDAVRNIELEEKETSSFSSSSSPSPTKLSSGSPPSTRPSSGLGGFQSVQPPDIRVRYPQYSDDVGVEDEKENVYEEDFDVDEETTEISVSRYNIADALNQKGTHGDLPIRRPSSRPVSAASASSRSSASLLQKRARKVTPGLRSAPPMSNDFHKYKHVFMLDPRYRDYFMSTEQRLQIKYQELNHLLNRDLNLPEEKYSSYAYQIGPRASTTPATTRAGSLSPRQRPTPRNISIYYLRKKKKETETQRPTSAPPGGLPKIQLTNFERRASPSILKGKHQRKQEGYESDASSDHGSAKKVTFVEPEWRKEKEARKKSVDGDGRRSTPPRILEEDDDRDVRVGDQEEDDFVSEIRKLHFRDSDEEEEEEEEENKRESGRKSALGFVVPPEDDRESTSEGEKGEDEDEEEEESGRREREERRKRRAKTAKGYRQKSARVRSEEESDEPESGDSGILTDNERDRESDERPGKKHKQDRRGFVDHHLKFSQNERLINWLRKKNNDLMKVKSKIRKEERDYKRREKQRQVEAEEKRKQSEAAVQAWFLKKKEEERSLQRKYLEMLQMTSGNGWEAMSESQKRLLRQMVINAEGRVGESLENEMRRFKEEEDSRVEEMKREKTEGKREKLVKEEKKEKTEEEIEREMEEALQKLGEWEGADTGQVFAQEEEDESESKEKEKEEKEEEEEEEENPEKLKERLRLAEERGRRQKILHRNMHGYKQDEIKKDPYYQKLLQDIKNNKVTKDYPRLGSLHPQPIRSTHSPATTIQLTSKKSSRRAGTSVTSRSSRSQSRASTALK